MQFNLYRRLATSERLSLLLLLGGGALLALGLAALVAFASPAIAVAAIIAVTAGLVILSNIEFGFYAVIGVVVLLPFASVPINLGFNPTLLDLALVLLFAM